MLNPSDHFTGKVFRSYRFDGHTSIENEKFQLEAVIDGQTTRLQAEGQIPEGCLYDRRHSGLELKSVLESYPAIYVVGCNCGYEARMRDVNAGFRYDSTMEE